MIRGSMLLLAVLLAACAKSSGSSPDGASPTACPKDLSGSVGKPCASDGQICAPPGMAVRMISCSGGKWVELNAPPPPPPPKASASARP